MPLVTSPRLAFYCSHSFSYLTAYSPSLTAFSLSLTASSPSLATSSPSLTASSPSFIVAAPSFVAIPHLSLYPICSKETEVMHMYCAVHPILLGTSLDTLHRSMISGAGEAFSRWCWPSSRLLLLSIVISLVISHFGPLLIRVCIFMLIGRRNSHRIFCRRQAPWLLVFSTVPTASRPFWWVVSPTMSREDSLATAALGLSEISSGEPRSGCRLKRLDVKHVHGIDSASQLLMKHRSEFINSPFPDSGNRETTNSMYVAPLCSSGASLQISYLNFNRYFGSGDSQTHQSFLTVCYLDFLCCVLFSSSSLMVNPRSCLYDEIGASVFSGDSWKDYLSRTPTNRVFSVRSCPKLSYLFLKKVLLMDSSDSFLSRSSSSFKEGISSPNLPSREGDISSDLFPSFNFSLFTGLSSCVAVSTGPEEVTETYLVGENWRSTSLYVTIFLLSDYVVKAISMHPSTVLNSQSSSLEDLSFLFYVVVVYAFNQRGCSIPSTICNQTS